VIPSLLRKLRWLFFCQQGWRCWGPAAAFPAQDSDRQCNCGNSVVYGVAASLPDGIGCASLRRRGRSHL